MTPRSATTPPDVPGQRRGAAALLVRNHALVDGNKCLAWSAARIFCLLNGRDLAYSVDDAEQMMLVAAAGGLDVLQVAV